MPESLIDEINDLARQLAAIDNEDVAASAGIIAREYKARVDMIYALDGVDGMLQQDIVALENRLQDRLTRAREELRDKLKNLLEWARSTGRT